MHRIHRWALTVLAAIALAFGVVAAPELTAPFVQDAPPAVEVAENYGLCVPGSTCGNIWP
jgi:hypothetical protein